MYIHERETSVFMSCDNVTKNKKQRTKYCLTNFCTLFLYFFYCIMM